MPSLALAGRRPGFPLVTGVLTVGEAKPVPTTHATLAAAADHDSRCRARRCAARHLVPRSSRRSGAATSSCSSPNLRRLACTTSRLAVEMVRAQGLRCVVAVNRADLGDARVHSFLSRTGHRDRPRAARRSAHRRGLLPRRPADRRGRRSRGDARCGVGTHHRRGPGPETSPHDADLSNSWSSAARAGRARPVGRRLRGARRRRRARRLRRRRRRPAPGPQPEPGRARVQRRPAGGDRSRGLHRLRRCAEVCRFAAVLGAADAAIPWTRSPAKAAASAVASVPPTPSTWARGTASGWSRRPASGRWSMRASVSPRRTPASSSRWCAMRPRRRRGARPAARHRRRPAGHRLPGHRLDHRRRSGARGHRTDGLGPCTTSSGCCSSCGSSACRSRSASTRPTSTRSSARAFARRQPPPGRHSSPRSTTTQGSRTHRWRAWTSSPTAAARRPTSRSCGRA